jgi:hypothetical protein
MPIATAKKPIRIFLNMMTAPEDFAAGTAACNQSIKGVKLSDVRKVMKFRRV